jgi:hypothetical protein
MYPESIECYGYGECHSVNLANLVERDYVYGFVQEHYQGSPAVVVADLFFEEGAVLYADQICAGWDRGVDGDPWGTGIVVYADETYDIIYQGRGSYSGCRALTSWKPVSYVEFTMSGDSSYNEIRGDKVVLRVVGYEPGPTPVPTVTPTPTPVSTPIYTGTYCCEVVCQDPGYNPWAGTIPVVEAGEGTCFEWAGADLSAVGLGTIPPMRICFAPIRFGVVGILGVTVNLDVISLVLSAVVTLRLLWRS